MRLTTPENIRNNVRPVSKHVDDSRIDIYIKEAEQLNIKPRIGDELYIDLIKYVDSDETSKTTFPNKYYKKLLNGGNYLTPKGNKKNFVGLIECLNYYVYAKLLRNNNKTVTRFGLSEKEDEYSSNVEFKEKRETIAEVLSAADMYMADCIEFLKINAAYIPKFKQGKQKNRLRITIIGK